MTRRRSQPAIFQILVTPTTTLDAETVAQSLGEVITAETLTASPLPPQDLAVLVDADAGSPQAFWAKVAAAAEYLTVRVGTELNAPGVDFVASRDPRITIDTAQRVIGVLDPRRVSPSLRASIIAAADGVCGLCGDELYDPIDIDHIRQVHDGGLALRTNLRASHKDCNQRRQRRTSPAPARDRHAWRRPIPIPVPATLVRHDGNRLLKLYRRDYRIGQITLVSRQHRDEYWAAIAAVHYDGEFVYATTERRRDLEQLGGDGVPSLPRTRRNPNVA